MTFPDALLLMALAAAQPTPQPAPQMQTISGPARVIDGDSLDVNANGRHVRIRIFGIDAVELHQRCTDGNGLPFNCGLLAADALEEEIGGAPVDCLPIDTDRFKRTVAVCTARGQDLGRRMVERGFALDYTFFSGGRYGDAEKEARAAKRGLWSGTFQEPREWRKEHRP